MKKIGNVIQFFYFFVLVSILSFAGFNLYFFMDSRLSDLNYLSTIQESELILNKIKQDDLPEQISRLINGDKVRPAIKIMDDFESDIKKIAKVNSVAKQNKFVEELNLTKKSLSKLLSFPETSSLFEVFDSKMKGFYQLASKNNWKTLSRISERIMSKTGGQQEFTVRKLNSLHDYVSKNIDMMKRITTSSLLSDVDKDLITKYLGNVEIELTLWKNYLSEVDDYLVTQKNFLKYYQEWLKEVGPAISLEKIEVQNKNKKFVLLQFFFMALIFVFMLAGILVYKTYSNKIVKKIEIKFLEIVRKSLTSSKFTDLEKGFTDNFQFEVKKAHTYIQKRMTFSSIFQKGLPFSALLLNQNLKVVWANPLFCDNFKISEQELDKETLGWDYIVRFTNLGDVDPILESLKNGLSGIYQIQVRPDHNSKSLPYEMYVSAISNGGQNYIMIFLYPLESVNETILNQVKSVIRPIQTTLKKFIKNEFDEDFANLVKDDFLKAEVLDVFDLFVELAEQINLRQDSLLNDISKLEEEVGDHFKMINDLSFHNDSFKSLQVDLLGNMKSLKQNIVGYVSENNNQSSLSEEFLGDLKDLLIKTRDFHRISRDGYSKIDEVKKIILSLDKVKQGIKPLHETINILNTRITQNFDKVLLFDGVENIDLKKLALGVQKSRSELEHLNKKLSDFSNVIKYIDLKLTKASIIVDGSDEVDKLLTDFESEIQSYEKRVEEKSFNKNQFAQNIQVSEEKIIKTVEDFFSILKKNINHYSIVSNMMKKFLDSEFNEASNDGVEYDSEEGAKIVVDNKQAENNASHSASITQ